MRSILVLPTFNEADNIDRFLRTLRAASDIDVLVVDDNSPDGTADLAEELGRELGGVRVLRRAEKDGLGSAYRAGFRQVLDHARDSALDSHPLDHAVATGLRGNPAPVAPDPQVPYDVVVSMDADLSHDPAVIPTMLDLIGRGADAVIGSRYIAGGETVNWPLHRRLLSSWGNAYTRWWLKLPVRDSTSGFRAYRASALRSIEPTNTTAEGYAFLTELMRRLARRGLVVVETPIVFHDRTEGSSKMSGRIVAESMVLVTSWGLRDRVGRLIRRGTPDPSTGSTPGV